VKEKVANWIRGPKVKSLEEFVFSLQGWLRIYRIVWEKPHNLYNPGGRKGKRLKLVSFINTCKAR
jgi:hypothetical protein